MRSFIIILLIGFNLCCLAGNPLHEKAKADFKKVNRVYLATPAYSLDIQYSVFDNHVGGNMVEQKFGQYFKNKENSYTKLLNIETAVNPKTTVIANNEDRVLVITDTKKIELSPIQTNVDTLLKLCKDVKSKDIGATERFYTLDFGDNSGSEFSKIELYVNLSNYTIKKMVMYYDEAMQLNQNDFYAEEKKPRLEIVYKSFKPMATINEALFAENTYLTYSNNIYKGKGKYSNYKIINQMQSARFKKK